MHVIYDELYSLTRWKAKLHLKRICGAQGHLIRSALYDILRIFHENPWKSVHGKSLTYLDSLSRINLKKKVEKTEKSPWKYSKKFHGLVHGITLYISMDRSTCPSNYIDWSMDTRPWNYMDWSMDILSMELRGISLESLEISTWQILLLHETGLIHLIKGSVYMNSSIVQELYTSAV